MDWHKLNDTQQTKILENGKLIIVSDIEHEQETVPLFCFLCEFPMKTKQDGISYKKHGCCEKCDNRWTNTPGVDWENNKFPNKLSKDWEEYYNERVILSKPIINIK